MATTDETLSAPARNPESEGGPRHADAPEEASLKRRASAEQHAEDDSPKRAKHAVHDDTGAFRPRRSATPDRRHSGDAPSNAGQERQVGATQEEKKRGKRLFGGLLSTLSQKTNTQQKRRQEIEKKQQERVREQEVEDDRRKAVRAASLHDTRMAEQIVFDEEALHARHAKELATARYLWTKAEPRIYYLPWKPTVEQEATIEEQIRRAKASIELEVESFEVRKQAHIKRWGPSILALSEDGPPEGTLAVDTPDRINHPETRDHAQEAEEVEGDHHDDSGDVLVEADEDMVIY